MSKLKLNDVKKTYKNGEIVHALKDISLEFRDNEFIAILGPSGCGKTTLLNIIGGLDRYDSGDLMLGDLSTKNFKDADWDAFRNRSIGFVFQNYNLITHQTVLQNVEIALTLSGVSTTDRRRRAKDALASVGLSDQIKKKPNQLSGGQMQRVAIARALVNNPEIILADEPTGALDSHASVQLMEILKEISNTRLVIMVTHNAELADQYSSRIIRLLDGQVQSDSNPLLEDKEIKIVEKKLQPVDKKLLKKTSMSIETAGALSFKNLLTKKGRSITTAFAASIGIIGVALVLALSTGFSGYMTQMQTESLAGMPISINEEPLTIDTSWQKWKNQRGEIPLLSRPDESGRFTEDNVLYRHDSQTNSIEHRNVLTQEYFDYIANIKSELPDAVNSVSYSRAVGINLLAKGEDSVIKYETIADSDIADEEVMFYGDGTYWQEIDDNAELNLSLYDLIGEGSRLPKAKDEVAIVVDEYNRIDKVFFEKLGMHTETDNYTLTDFIGKTKLKVIPNDAYYTKTENGLFIPAPASKYSELYENADGVELTVTGILRIKENSASVINYLVPGFVYTTALTDYIVDNAQKSEITVAQKDSNFDVVSNTPFVGGTEKKERLLSLGADTTPTSIKIYPKDYAGKGTINDYLDAYNVGKSEENQIVYSDVAEMMESMVGSMVNATAYILIGFAAISLMVSTIMIAIITYVSVLERTKEIGILRSIGARKKDISRVFNVEAVIIGLVAGLLGVGISFLLTIPINLIISSLAGISGIANLTILNTILLVLGSMCLTLIAGFIPARMAANQDPVVALRK